MALIIVSSIRKILFEPRQKISQLSIGLLAKIQNVAYTAVSQVCHGPTLLKLTQNM